MNEQSKRLVTSDGSQVRGRLVKKKMELELEKFKKGELLIVKVPPFYDREYLYEVTGAGGKQVRASLYHSPTVKKQWTFEDLALLFNNGMIRMASPEDIKKFQQEHTTADNTTEEEDG